MDTELLILRAAPELISAAHEILQTLDLGGDHSMSPPNRKKQDMTRDGGTRPIDLEALNSVPSIIPA
jgi:hypothetical protein